MIDEMYNFKDKNMVGGSVQRELYAIYERSHLTSREVSIRNRRERKILIGRLCRIINKIKNFTLNK